MIFNLTIVALITIFSTHLNTIWTADELEHEIAAGLLMLSEWVSDDDESGDNSVKSRNTGDEDTDSSVQLDSSTSTPSSSKRKKTETPTQNERVKNRKKYCHGILPINPRLSKNMVDKLANWERLFLDKGGKLIWKNIMNLQEKEGKRICVKEWEFQAQTMPELELKTGMVPDCTPFLVPGPSKKTKNHRYCLGNVRYAPELLDQEFFPDLVRCNCAYLMKSSRKDSYYTVRLSKRFFYLHRDIDAQEHFVLTAHGQFSSTRRVKFVHVRKLKADEL